MSVGQSITRSFVLVNVLSVVPFDYVIRATPFLRSMAQAAAGPPCFNTKEDRRRWLRCTKLIKAQENLRTAEDRGTGEGREGHIG